MEFLQKEKIKGKNHGAPDGGYLILVVTNTPKGKFPTKIKHRKLI
jgi:hypothetical protein